MLKCFFAVLGLWIFFSSLVFAQEPDSLQPNLGIKWKNNSGKYQIFPVGEGISHAYQRPKSFEFFTNGLPDIGRFCRITFQQKNAMRWAAMIASTAVLVAADQEITNAAEHVGRHWHISPTNKQKAFINFSVKLGGTSLALPLNGPTDLSSAMYFLGDGITHSTIAGCFYGYGLITKDYRAIQTSSQLIESILTTGLIVQILKHSTGRESPKVRTVSGGKWRLLPSPVEYAKHVPNYDAYPTGHLATAMATVTVIADNYPEHKYIRPLGYSLMTVLGFAMVNNGVHWASDYPLGIAIGYTFAKIAVARGTKVIHSEEQSSVNSEDHLTHSFLQSAEFSPMIENNTLGCSFTYRFN